MDLDVKVKATVLGAAFLIVSIQLMVVLLMVCLKSWLVVWNVLKMSAVCTTKMT